MANPQSRIDMAGSRPSPRTLRSSLLAFEIADFGDRRCGHDVLVYLHKRLYAVLESAFTEVGVRWSECFRQDRSDGALVIMPPTIPVGDVLDPLIARILSGLRRHNEFASDPAKITLRMAMTTGTVHFDAYGVIGHDLTRLFDLLKAAEFIERFSHRTELGVVVSDALHEDVVGQMPGLIGGAGCRSIRAVAGGRPERAWICFADRVAHHLPRPESRPEPRPEPRPETAQRGVVLDLVAFAAARRTRC